MGEVVAREKLWDACMEEYQRIFTGHYDDLRNGVNIKDQQAVEAMLTSKRFQDYLKTRKNTVPFYSQAAQGYKDMEKLRAMYTSILQGKPWEKYEDEVFTLLYGMAKEYISTHPFLRYSLENQASMYSVILHERFALHLARRYTKKVYATFAATAQHYAILPALQDQLPKYLKGIATHLLEGLSQKDSLSGKRICTMILQEDIGYGASFLPCSKKIIE